MGIIMVSMPDEVLMKDTANLTDGEFHHDLLELVHREFGLDGLSRFMTLYCEGKGDYTRDRHIWLDGLTIEQITEQAQTASHTKAA